MNFLKKIQMHYTSAKVSDSGPERMAEIAKRANDDLAKFVDDLFLWAKDQNLEPSTPKLKKNQASISCLKNGILITVQLKDGDSPGYRVDMHVTGKMRDRLVSDCRKMSEKATKKEGYYREVFWG